MDRSRGFARAFRRAGVALYYCEIDVGAVSAFVDG
jgi:hypothetical protein